MLCCDLFFLMVPIQIPQQPPKTDWHGFVFYSLPLCTLFVIDVSCSCTCVYTGTYPNLFRKGDGDHFEPQVFHFSVWHCLQASYTRNRYIIIGKNFLHKMKRYFFNPIFLTIHAWIANSWFIPRGHLFTESSINSIMHEDQPVQ